MSKSKQARVAIWLKHVFDETTASNVKERTLRAVEEIVELAQAADIDAATVHHLVDYVFARPTGVPAQEVAGSMVTLYSAAVALGIDADAAFEEEFVRVNRPEIVEKIRRRQAEKREALMTFDGHPDGIFYYVRDGKVCVRDHNGTEMILGLAPIDEKHPCAYAVASICTGAT